MSFGGWLAALLNLLGMGGGTAAPTAHPATVTGTYAVPVSGGTYAVPVSGGTYERPTSVGTWEA